MDLDNAKREWELWGSNGNLDTVREVARNYITALKSALEAARERKQAAEIRRGTLVKEIEQAEQERDALISEYTGCLKWTEQNWFEAHRKMMQERDALRDAVGRKALGQTATLQFELEAAGKQMAELRKERDAAREQLSKLKAMADELNRDVLTNIQDHIECPDCTKLLAAVGKMCELCKRTCKCVTDCPLYPHRDTATTEPESKQGE